MDSASVQFVAFGLLVALLSNLSGSRLWRSMVLFSASIVFLMLLQNNPLLFLPLAGFLLLGYLGLVLLERGLSRSAVWSILLTIASYIWLKKYSFLPPGIFIHSPYFTLGLSYIFFRLLHLLIEAGNEKEKARIGAFQYILYTLNFTTLVSGPIQRYNEFAKDQFADPPIGLGVRTVGLQLERIIRGFFKVNVLASLFHGVQQDALAQVLQPFPLGIRLFAALRLIIVYPFFIYSNFSGYIDIVLALARLMRIRLPENFDRPLSSTSFLDFWNRWHITLSRWFKTYVYNPMLIALMRRFPSPSLEPWLGVLCFFITFFLVGVWHGRTSVFVFYGILQGAGISINKAWQLTLTRLLGRKGYKALAANLAYETFARGLTFTWFALTLFWFWGTWQQIGKLTNSLTVLQWASVWIAVWILASAILGAWEMLRHALLSIGTPGEPALTARYARVVYASAMALAALVMTVVLNQAAPDIVYKAF